MSKIFYGQNLVIRRLIELSEDASYHKAYSEQIDPVTHLIKVDNDTLFTVIYYDGNTQTRVKIILDLMGLYDGISIANKLNSSLKGMVVELDSKPV